MHRSLGILKRICRSFSLHGPDAMDQRKQRIRVSERLGIQVFGCETIEKCGTGVDVAVGFDGDVRRMKHLLKQSLDCRTGHAPVVTRVDVDTFGVDSAHRRNCCEQYAISLEKPGRLSNRAGDVEDNVKRLSQNETVELTSGYCICRG